VFTDKLVAKIPSTASGVIKQINFENDSICAVGHPIMTIETEDDSPAEPSQKTQHAAPAKSEP
jgi:pyruvate/2-oxoglutarate dehydrogenase complex dihydrolipoamide acyltransferase (E2) component